MDLSKYKPRESIELDDGKTVNFCGRREWAPGSVISCNERAKYMMDSYKMKSRDAKVSILDQGCACVDTNTTSASISATHDTNTTAGTIIQA